MKHETEQAQIFYILNRIDYSKTWEQIEYELGYDLGDHYFKEKQTYLKIKEAAKHLWAIFNGFLNHERNVITQQP